MIGSATTSRTGCHQLLPRPRRTGPTAVARSMSVPCWRTTMTCWRASSAATALVSSIKSRQEGPPTTRAASLGQIVASGLRCRSSTRIVASRRARWPRGVGSHHGSPRSPKATLASFTRGRAVAGSTRTSRRADISSATSSVRNDSGIVGSEALQRRPATVTYRPSLVRSGFSTPSCC
jgi:hypothetical protein